MVRAQLERLRGAQHITDFDASINAVRAVSSFLDGQGHPAMSTGPSSRVLAKVATLPSARLRAGAYRGAALGQGLPLDEARRVDVDTIDEWVTEQYGPGPFPAVVIGSVGGPAFFLAAALGAPFLPQTTLVSFRDLATHVDDPAGAMEALAPTARLIAANNPRLAVYHMHDPAQDRPMMQSVAFMRLKRLALGPVYERFLRERLAPGGAVVQLEHTRDWRGRQVGDRASFQFGCLGGVSEEEYHHGSPRIAAYLEQEGSPVRAWAPPEPDGRRPDAEWGWHPALGEDIGRLAGVEGWRVRHLRTHEPQDASGFVAELYRDWYRRLGRPDDRLLVQTYAHVDPYWTLRRGWVPFWSRFPMTPSYEVLRGYLRRAEPYQDIRVTLFSHGVESPGVVPVEDWEALAAQHAGRSGKVIGTSRRTYPLDTGSAFRYHRAITELPGEDTVPAPLTVTEVDEAAARLATNPAVGDPDDGAESAPAPIWSPAHA